MRKGGDVKEFYIDADAYPSAAGLDIIELIKTTNLDILFDCLVEYDEYTMEPMEEEPVAFSLAAFKNAAKTRTILYTREGEHYFIENSISCEYAYLVDLDEQELRFFTGKQKKKQERNEFGNMPYGTHESRDRYYPCHLKQRFSLDYIRYTDANTIVSKMEIASMRGSLPSPSVGILTSKAADDDPHAMAEQKDELTAEISQLSSKLSTIAALVPSSEPISIRRIEEIKYECFSVEKAIKKLEQLVDLYLR